MRISCEINLAKCPQHVYRPNSAVAGQIKYILKDEEEFNSITVSLEGIVKVKVEDRRGKSTSWYKKKEKPVRAVNVIVDSNKKLPPGVYETHFDFMLPLNIPGSFEYHKSDYEYEIHCTIKYIFFIKFDLSDLDKYVIFKKELNVHSGITPILSTIPVMCGERKNLFSFFKQNTEVILKVNMEKCVYRAGEIIKLQYEVTNNSHKTIKGVETKLMEICTFLKEHKKKTDIPNSDTKTGAVKSGKTSVMDIAMAIPEDAFCLENSEIVSRGYEVLVVVVLPIPHINLYLKIPVQIGEPKSEIGEDCQCEKPPPYWQAMEEKRKMI